MRPLSRPIRAPDVLRLEDVEPPIPEADEVRVRIHATTVSRTTARCEKDRRSWPLTTGVRRPRRRILGSDLAGEVDTVGSNVTEFEVGDRSSASIREVWCARRAPLHAARRAVADAVRHAVRGAAAICDGAILALNALRPANLRKGRGFSSTVRRDQSERRGAAGQAFRCRRQRRVQPKSIELVRRSARRGHRLHTAGVHGNGQSYDVILDAVGTLRFRLSGLTQAGGVYLPRRFRNLFLSPGRR